MKEHESAYVIVTKNPHINGANTATYFERT